MRLLFSFISIFSISLLCAQSGEEAKIYKNDSSQAGSFELVDVRPSIDPKIWRKLVVSSLQKPIEYAASKGMKGGSYTVKVQFIVEIDGSITEIKALNDPGYALAKASEDIMRDSPNWNAAEKNGKKVRCYRIQPFTFIIQEQH
jgi:periplasmic protein TonB